MTSSNDNNNAVYNLIQVIVTCISLVTLVVVLFLSVSRETNAQLIEIEKQNYIPIHVTRFEVNTWYQNVDAETQFEFEQTLIQHVGNDVVVRKVIEGALKYDVPIILAFAIAWTESRFYTRALNENTNGTFDYGLFQINSGYTDFETVEEHFNLDNNVSYALSLLRGLYTLNHENWVLAITSYNAGAYGIRDGISYTTLMHLQSVLSQEEYMHEIIAPIIEDSI